MAPILTEQLFLKQSKLHEVENSTPLGGPEPTTARLYAECSNRWATEMWHFPINSLGYMLSRPRYFVCSVLNSFAWLHHWYVSIF